MNNNNVDGNYSTTNTLKRKNENGVEEQKLEAAIKRVALEDDDRLNTNSDSLGSDVEVKADDSSIAEQKTLDDHVHLRMLCVVKDASLIVGPKGETISKIKRDCNCRVNVSENIRGVPERVVYIRGSCENVGKAFGMIARVLNSNSSKKGDHNDNTKETDNDNDNDSNKIESSPITLHILVTHHLMGYVIGKHGSRLKEIEELSGAKLSASPQQLLPSNDRILKVFGVADAVHIATFYIAQTILTYRDILKTRKAIFYQPGPVYSALGNTSSFMNGLPMQLQQRQSHYHTMDRYNNYRNRRSPRAPIVMMIHPPSVSPPQHNADAHIIYTPESAANATSFVPNFTIPNVRIVDGLIATQPMSMVRQEIFIDESFVGNVIGKEGKHINSIKETTGCSIYIEDPVKGAFERKLSIEGTSMGAQAAIMLISNKIEMDRANSLHNSNNNSQERLRLGEN